ncbi:MAG: 3-oxoacyl-ACP reductase FabG, partial [candidate division NC10 bacterium]|nr:3-oxoacyl-ACP reductase FabG [candidate division NC10 bacterium]
MDALAGALDLTGRVAVVTGGTRGIGLAIVERFAAAGARVVAMSRSGERVAPGGRAEGAVTVLAGDVSSKADVDRVLGEVLARHGTVDILVSCAGVIRRKPALETTEADCAFLMDVNLKGAFLAAQAVAPVMRRAGRGRIINVASIGADLALMNRAVYCAAKAGVVQLTRCLAQEWGPYGITVNAFSPGITETPMTRAYLEGDPVRHRTMIEKTPLRRLGRPEDMAGVALFLASDLASYVTGQTIYVDGGWGLGD